MFSLQPVISLVWMEDGALDKTGVPVHMASLGSNANKVSLPFTIKYVTYINFQYEIPARSLQNLLNCLPLALFRMNKRISLQQLWHVLHLFFTNFTVWQFLQHVSSNLSSSYIFTCALPLRVGVWKMFWWSIVSF